MDGCELPCKCWDPPDPLPEQPVLLTKELLFFSPSVIMVLDISLLDWPGEEGLLHNWATQDDLTTSYSLSITKNVIEICLSPSMCVPSSPFHSPRRKEEGLQIYWILNIFGPHYRSGSYGKNIITARPVLNKQVFEGDPLKESSPTNTPCFSRCLSWFPLPTVNQSQKSYLSWLLQQKDHICM